MPESPAAAARRVYLVRHGETEGESSVRFHGSNDVPLSDLGRAQVGRLGPLLCDLQFAAVVHSPLRRAAVSAQLLVAALRCAPASVEAHEGFREVCFGAIEGMTEAEIRDAMPEWHRAWRAGEVEGFPGGESFSGFDERVVAAWLDVVARHPQGDLLLVAHRGVVRRVLEHCLPDYEQGVGVDLGSLSVLRTDDSASLVSFNVVPNGP